MRNSIKIYRTVDHVYRDYAYISATFIFSSDYIKERWIIGKVYGIRIIKL